ncbi:MAG: hypothetical protein ACYC9Q_07550 [Bacillota bacterium]
MRRPLLVCLALILVLAVAVLGGPAVAAAPANGNVHVVKLEPATEYCWAQVSDGHWYRYKSSIRWHAVYTLLDPLTNLWHLTRQSHDGVFLEVVDGKGHPLPNPTPAQLSMIGARYQGFYTGTLTGVWDAQKQKLANPGNWDMQGMWKAWRPDGLEFSNSRVLIHPNPANPTAPATPKGQPWEAGPFLLRLDGAA